MRREAKRQMLLLWDVPRVISVMDIDPNDVLYGRKSALSITLSELGAELVSLDESEFIAAWLIRRMGFNARKAGGVLMVISSELGTVSEDRNKNLELIDEALKFRR
jgi:hypothetical protein